MKLTRIQRKWLIKLATEGWACQFPIDVYVKHMRHLGRARLGYEKGLFTVHNCAFWVITEAGLTALAEWETEDEEAQHQDDCSAASDTGQGAGDSGRSEPQADHAGDD